MPDLVTIITDVGSAVGLHVVVDVFVDDVALSGGSLLPPGGRTGGPPGSPYWVPSKMSIVVPMMET